jgi:hypothetical protein
MLLRLLVFLSGYETDVDLVLIAFFQIFSNLNSVARLHVILSISLFSSLLRVPLKLARRIEGRIAGHMVLMLGCIPF